MQIKDSENIEEYSDKLLKLKIWSIYRSNNWKCWQEKIVNFSPFFFFAALEEREEGIKEEEKFLETWRSNILMFL